MIDPRARKQMGDKIDRAFKDAVMIVGNECTKIISENRSWAGFPAARDLVDLGQLRASQRLTFEENGTTLVGIIEYTAEYAAPVHNGATIRYSNGNTRRIVGRPWITEALSAQPIDDNMGKLLS